MASEESWFDLWQGEDVAISHPHLSQVPKLAVGPTRPVDCIMWVKWSGHEVDHSSPSIAKLKNEWSCTSTWHMPSCSAQGHLYIDLFVFQASVLRNLDSVQFWYLNIIFNELRFRMKQEDIIKFIKSQRLRWDAHVMRMENTRTTRKIIEWTPYKTRPVGRPRLRWMDQVEEDLKRMKIVGWRAKVEDGQEWNRIVEETKTHPGL